MTFSIYLSTNSVSIRVNSSFCLPIFFCAADQNHFNHNIVTALDVITAISMLSIFSPPVVLLSFLIKPALVPNSVHFKLKKDFSAADLKGAKASHLARLKNRYIRLFCPYRFAQSRLNTLPHPHRIDVLTFGMQGWHSIPDAFSVCSFSFLHLLLYRFRYI